QQQVSTHDSRRRHISEMHPNGLPYTNPRPLIRTSGADWDFQAHMELVQTMRDGIREHYFHFMEGRYDKMYMPIYLFLSGAGTGKSRNASEFHNTAMSSLSDDDTELRIRLQHAWAFHVTLENGTALQPSELDPVHAVGSRMLLQLVPGTELVDILRDYEAPHPLDVIRLVAKHYNQQLSDSTIILVVDGMQRLMSNYEAGLQADSVFYKTLTAIGDLTQYGAFILPCCTATVTRPVNECLKSSVRKRVFLPVAPLTTPQQEGRPIFDQNSALLRILESDCGGHGRALEILWDLIRSRDMQRCDVGELMVRLRTRLAEQYREAFPEQHVAKAIINAVLTHQRLSTRQIVPNISLYPDQLVEPGLIRFDKDPFNNYGYLHVPYIWLWVMAAGTGDNDLLSQWKFNDYSDLLAREDRTLPSGCSWENFEKINARFRSMKSQAMADGQFTSISQVHHGASLSNDIAFRNHPLDISVAHFQTSTKTTLLNRFYWPVICSRGFVSIRDHKNIVLNASSAPYGDAFLSLDSMPTVNEVHQYKFYTGDSIVNQELYNREREKAAGRDDFFLLITTQNAQRIELPPNSGIVDRSVWSDYFGPFAGRAYIYLDQGLPNINSADYVTLQLVNGIGDARATQILELRPFSSIDDAARRTGISRKILEGYMF
ncbi:hypothetical protein BGZ46_002378, partial [Entomortierella lignicola]